MKNILLTLTYSLLLLGSAACRQYGNSSLPLPAIPLEGAKDIDALMEHISGARMVLLGEATHGTREFYLWRKEITRRLVEEYGFDFVAVEGDWPAHYRLNRYVKGMDDYEDLERLFSVFSRWPEWMWKNPVVAELVKWLKEHNSGSGKNAGFYGMDVYGSEYAYNNIAATLMEAAGSDAADEIKGLIEGVGSYASDMQSYAQDYARTGLSYGDDLAEARRLLKERMLPGMDSEKALELERNMAVLVYAEKHFRAMADPSLNSWNERVKFMDETLRKLIAYYGQESRGVVWAHNTHIGDARATSMAGQGNVNIGQLQREYLGRDQVKLVGFGTASGTVRAGRFWGSPGEVMTIPDPVEDSIEHLLSGLGRDKLLFLFNGSSEWEELMKVRGHRAIGVVYNPLMDNLHNFVPTLIAERYDAFIFFQSTEAIEEWRD